MTGFQHPGTILEPDARFSGCVRVCAVSLPIDRVGTTRDREFRIATTNARIGCTSWLPDRLWYSAAGQGCKCTCPFPENGKGATKTYHPKTGIMATPHVHHLHSRSAGLLSSGPVSQRAVASLPVRYACQGTGVITTLRFGPVRAVYALVGVLSTASTTFIGK